MMYWSERKLLRPFIFDKVCVFLAYLGSIILILWVFQRSIKPDLEGIRDEVIMR